MSRYMLSLYLHKPGLDTRFETFPQGVFFQQRSRGYVRAFAPLTPQSFGTFVECMDLDLSKSYGRGDASDKRVSAVDEGQRQL